MLLHCAARFELSFDSVVGCVQRDHGSAARDELVFCASPPCGPYGQLSPSVQFHVHQTMSPGPHPMTFAAIARAKDATSLARDDQIQESKDAETLSEVRQMVYSQTEKGDEAEQFCVLAGQG